MDLRVLRELLTLSPWVEKLRGVWRQDNMYMHDHKDQSRIMYTTMIIIMRPCINFFPFPHLQLHAIGVLCGLMPSINKLNHDTVLIKQICSGVTPVSPQGGCGQ